jgi:hypothetical protein
MARHGPSFERRYVPKGTPAKPCHPHRRTPNPMVLDCLRVIAARLVPWPGKQRIAALVVVVGGNDHGWGAGRDIFGIPRECLALLRRSC